MSWTRRAGGADPDWSTLADGRLHRLRAGRDYLGDSRLQVRAARDAARRLGLHAITARDDLGNSSYLWVQFVDGVVAAGDGGICPGCRDRTLVRRGPGVARCTACGRVYALAPDDAPPAAVDMRVVPSSEPVHAAMPARPARSALAAPAAASAVPAPPPPAAAAAAPEGGTTPAKRLRRHALLGHPQLAADSAKPSDLLRDTGFAETLRQVLDADASRLELRRLWTLWEATGVAAAGNAAGAAVGNTWAGGAAFLALALRRRAGEQRRCLIVEHPHYLTRPTRPSPERIESARVFLEDAGATVLRGDVAGVTKAVAELRYGVVHLDLADSDELARALSLFHSRLAAGGVIVVEDYRIPAARDRPTAGVAAGVAAFLATNPALATWRTPGRQLVLAACAP